MKNNNNSSDKELVLAYKSGKKEAFSFLVKKWHLQFCKLAFWYVKDADVAKDIAQESWKVILKKIENLEEPDKFKSWAISIVKRKAIDYLRLNKKRKLKLEKYYKDNTVNICTEGTENKESIYKKRLREGIQKLPENQKIVIQLFYIQNYSLNEISELINISVGTAKSRLFHAREKLKTILKHINYE
ncbi:RNA polymerase sigma factor [Tenacibaculum halocynthiae]|uniref:RNA polymerase sigma factor n=1 Tax=Tenacibaculum halocynthiae TaxID=1254437 RepID=UPI003D648C8D